MVSLEAPLFMSMEAAGSRMVIAEIANVVFGFIDNGTMDCSFETAGRFSA